MTRWMRWAAALALVLPLAAALAAGVKPEQLAALQRGMTEDQVLALLGKPPRSYPITGGLGGRSWVYPLEGSSVINGTIIEVDFSAEGRVNKISQRFVQDFN